MDTQKKGMEDWLYNTCRLESPTLPSKGQNQQWPANGQIGYMTPAGRLGSPTLHSRGKIRSGPHVGALATELLPSGVSNASQRGRKSEVAHEWADWWVGPQWLNTPGMLKKGGLEAKKSNWTCLGYIHADTKKNRHFR